ncbi:MAG: polysaccharide biosynthesis protein [Chloroflexi bacterium]|nr:polysaccharide biosynthesis protein [Chloroflexota bacterium]
MSLVGATVMITGGTGSFGNRVARFLLGQGVAEIRIYSRDEKKQWEMQRALPELRYIIGDVRDLRRLNVSMQGVDFVFHAAALKQVPACEQYPGEAMMTNSVGSLNVCEAASAARVRRVVALSTDKAVKPINAMGISKAMMEKIVAAQNFLPTDTVFCCVRYGNVMNSRGSVIPLFRQLIRRGEPLGVTVPEMTRFLLTLDQSVELVVHALASALGGEVFVRKAPACTVLDLARAMVRKYSPMRDEHPIQIVGIRPGEKIHEILVNEYEIENATEDDAYFTIHPQYRRPANVVSRQQGYEYTSENTERVTDYGALAALLDAAGDDDVYI